MDDWVLVQVKSRYKCKLLVLVYTSLVSTVLVYNHSNYYYTIMQYHWTQYLCLSSSFLASTYNFYFSLNIFDYLLLVTLY